MRVVYTKKRYANTYFTNACWIICKVAGKKQAVERAVKTHESWSGLSWPDRPENKKQQRDQCGQ